jgi:hypothetical protein
MNYIKTWKEIMLRPSDFYRRMQTTGEYTGPLTFVAISAIISGILTTLVRYVILTSGVLPGMLTLIDMRYSRPDVSIFWPVILAPISGIVGVFILALIFNLLYKVLGGTGNFNGTVKFLSYASAPGVLTWIPIGLIIGIYELYLYIVGGMIVHNVSMKKSTIIVLLVALPGVFFAVRAILSGFAA